MRESRDVFHLAIPAYDLARTEYFYVRQLGCKLARIYDDRITLDFFGDQLVCHKTEAPIGGPPTGEELDLYPRHFGVTFRRAADFEGLHHLCVERDIPFFRPLGTRFEGMVEVHRTFVVRDPSDNLLEFKHYADARMMY